MNAVKLLFCMDSVTEVCVMDALPFPCPLATEDIQHRRAMILSALFSADGGFCEVPVRSVHLSTLELALRLYDQLFFQGFLRRAYDEIAVTISSRLVSSAGKFLHVRGASRQRKAEIRMSGDFLFRLTDGPFLLNGLSVATPQEAFLVVFEHELCHALEYALFGATGHSSRFLSLARGLFGHTATRHSLPTRRMEAAREGLLVGSNVSFPFEGRTLSGTVSYIGKTATVMVPDRRGTYRDPAGKRYAKYRVPLFLITLR